MEFRMEMHEDGSWWVSYGKKWTGPFPNALAASSVICEIISDRAKELHGNNVYFLQGKFK